MNEAPALSVRIAMGESVFGEQKNIVFRQLFYAGKCCMYLTVLEVLEVFRVFKIFLSLNYVILIFIVVYLEIFMQFFCSSLQA